MQKAKYRWAPSIGGLEGTAEQVWGTEPYNPETDLEKPCVFFGLYGLPDFYSLWRHKGRRYILWAGSDINHFNNGYWLEDGGGIKLDPGPLAEWINRYCESWVENAQEQAALAEIGIQSQICPSFMGNVDDYEVTYRKNDRPNVYLSANPGREFEYGWGIIEDIADKCDVDFHLYGSNEWETDHSNVFVHGRIPKERMNEEIKHMQCGLRLNEQMDGFSEITAKSVLWGQYPLTWEHFKYPFIESFSNKNELIKRLNALRLKSGPNPARDYYKNVLNAYPWKV